MAFANYHTHTVFSDGKDSPRACVEAAREKGLAALGFSDHSFTPFDQSYCLGSPEQTEQYQKVIRAEQKRAREEDGFSVFLGVEWDSGSAVDRERYDYTIGSVHYLFRSGQAYPVDLCLEDQLACIQKEFHGNKLDYAKTYFEELVEHVSKNRPDIVGHFDLPNKFGCFDEEDEAYRKVVLEAMAETVRVVPLFEINTGAIAGKCRTEPYPHPSFLGELKRLGGQVVFSADAHRAADVNFAFDRAAEWAKQAGFETVSQYRDGRFLPIPIAE